MQNDFYYLLKIMHKYKLNRNLSHHFNPEIRIEYFKSIDNVDDLIYFMRYNQFIDGSGTRKDYLETFSCHLKTISNTSDKLKNILSLAYKMVKSEVKIRRELGANILIIMSRKNFIISSKVFQKLCFDSYEDIRILTNSFKDIRVSNILLLKKLKSFEYHDVYAAIEIIKKTGNINFFMKYFMLNMHYDVNSMVRNRLFGFIALINEMNLSFDNEVNLIYNKVFYWFKKNDDSCFDKNKTKLNVHWKTLKEIAIYYINKIIDLKDMEQIAEIIFNVNHLGLYNHIYYSLCIKFKKTEFVSFAPIRLFVDEIIKRCGDSNFSVTRRGAGVTLLFQSLFVIKKYENEYFSYLILKYEEFEDKKEINILWLNIFAKLVHKTNRLRELITICFNALLSNLWRVRNAAIQLFASIIKTLFGRNAFNRYNKKYVNEETRLLFFEHRHKSKYLYLIFLDRVRLPYLEYEYNFIDKCFSGDNLLRFKALKIINNKVNEFEKEKCLEMSTNYTILQIFDLLSNDDIKIRENACILATEYGFPLVCCEYLKYLIVRHSVEFKYFETISRSVKVPCKNVSRVKCFRDENVNGYYDYRFMRDMLMSKGI